MPIVHPRILEVRAPALNFFVLRDEKGLYVIDGGFIGGWRLLQNALRREGWQDEPVRGIVVSHGHLDHILNVAHLAKAYGAWIAAPRLDADHLDIASGIQAVHLPGHTAGHMGFWWGEEKLLLTGDLFVSYRDEARLPLDIFNLDSQQNVRSIETALALNPRGVLPNHGSLAAPGEHLRRLKRLHKRVSASRTGN
ncbi:MBL fold metallo-hydrolase [Bremerella alba]|nr:MBL fold metallo-hydrolase [Bremerella alba]